MPSAASLLWLLPAGLGMGAAAETCPDRGFDFFEHEGYRTRQALVSGFRLLRVSLAADPASKFASLAGQPFTAAGAEQAKTELRAKLLNMPSAFDSPVGITVVGIAVTGCDAATKELNIEYRVFTTKAALPLGRTFEHAKQEREHPAEALALAPTKVAARVTPRVGYDASQGLLAGGHFEARLPATGGSARIALDGQGSNKSLIAGGEIAGSLAPGQGWLRQLEWRGAFAYSELPSDRLQLSSGRFLGQISGVTAPAGPFLFRFGTLAEGGHQQSGLPQSSLPNGTVATARFANWRSFAGVSARAGRQSFAASYGLLLGRTGGGGAIDYRKQIADAVYSARILLAPHRPLEIDARFTAGFLAQLGPTPVSERFFGGNVETPFMPGSNWVIRANPVFRGIPAYRWNRTGANRAPGASEFEVLNLTLAIPLFGEPVIPKEASQDPEIRQKVDGFLVDGADGLVPVYELDDPAQKRLFQTRRESFAKTASAMEARVAALAASIPSALQPAYDACADKVGDFAANVEGITKTTPWRNFLKDDPDEGYIPVTLQRCVVELNGPLGDSELARLGDELRAHQKAIAADVAKIDTASARNLAAQTLEFPAAVLKTVFDEMTIVSISPLVTFDAGRLGTSPSVLAGDRTARYSAGVGLRVSLASSMSFELGYAWNLRQPQPWEGRGAVFLGIRFIDLFGR